jgi:hypothetical protein
MSASFHSLRLSPEQTTDRPLICRKFSNWSTSSSSSSAFCSSGFGFAKQYLSSISGVLGMGGVGGRTWKIYNTQNVNKNC